MKGKTKPQGRRSIQGRSLRGLHGRSATNQNGQAAKEEVSLIWRGLDVQKYFWRPGGEKCFSLDIPLNRTSGQRQPVPASGLRKYWMWRKAWNYQQLSKFGSHVGQPVTGHGVM